MIKITITQDIEFYHLAVAFNELCPACRKYTLGEVVSVDFPINIDRNGMYRALVALAEMCKKKEKT